MLRVFAQTPSLLEHRISMKGKTRMNSSTIEGVAVVTGAASGMGRATALRLARNGTTLVLADLNQDGLNETVSLFDEDHAPVATVSGDLASPDTVTKVFEAATSLGEVK